MNTMISISDMILILCGVSGFILLVFLIIMVASAISSLKKMNRILDDSKVVSEIIARRAEDADNLINSVGRGAGEMYAVLKDKERGFFRKLMTLPFLIKSIVKALR